MADLARDAVALVPRANRVGVIAQGDTSARVDGPRTRQLLVNLIQNALRHGDRGKIHVHVDGRGPEHVELSVDNPGDLEPSQLETLFDAFAQGDRASARQGVGLGLFVVRMIARAHGGEVTASSAEGRVVFRVELPRGS